MRHLTKDQLSAHADQALAGRAAEEAERHLADCEACRQALAALVAQDAALRPALTHDPGDAYFDNFAARVQDRIRSTPAPADRRKPGFAPSRWFSSPRALATVGAVAVVVAGAGLALMARREVTSPDLRDRELLEKSRQVASEADKRQLAPTPMSTAVPESSIDEPGGPAAATSDADLSKPQPEDEAKLEAAGREAPVATEQAKPAAPAAEAKDDRLDGAAKSALPVPSTRSRASANRATEVQRNEAGDVAARPTGERAQPMPPAAQEKKEAGELRKKLAAEPLRDALSRKAQGAAKSGAKRQEFAAPPPPASSPAATPPSATSPARTPPPATASATPAPEELQYRGGRADEVRFQFDSVAGAELRLCGEVRDRSGRPVVGAQVSLADLGRTTATDARGAFCIAAPAGEHGLAVMAVGFGEKRQTVRVGRDREPLKIKLEAVPVLDGKLGAMVRGAGSQAGGVVDAYSALPDAVRSIIRAAQQLEASATAKRSARLFDAAAGGWERALSQIEGHPLELDVRWHAAAARFHAWEAGPNHRRAEAATGALTGYAMRAPPGAEREQAARWLDQVRR